jgi:hypothetical protein
MFRHLSVVTVPSVAPLAVEPALKSVQVICMIVQPWTFLSYTMLFSRVILRLF